MERREYSKKFKNDSPITQGKGVLVTDRCES